MHPFVHLGDLSLPTYGLFYLTAYLAAISLAARLGTRLGIPFWKTVDVAFQFSIAGDIGSRLAFVLVEWEAFFGGEISMRQFFFAGRVVFGGLVAGALWGLWLFRKHRLPILAVRRCRDRAAAEGPRGVPRSLRPRARRRCRAGRAGGLEPGLVRRRANSATCRHGHNTSSSPRMRGPSVA